MKRRRERFLILLLHQSKFIRSDWIEGKKVFSENELLFSCSTFLSLFPLILSSFHFSFVLVRRRVVTGTFSLRFMCLKKKGNPALNPLENVWWIARAFNMKKLWKMASDADEETFISIRKRKGKVFGKKTENLHHWNAQAEEENHNRIRNSYFLAAKGFHWRHFN